MASIGLDLGESSQSTLSSSIIDDIVRLDLAKASTPEIGALTVV